MRDAHLRVLAYVLREVESIDDQPAEGRDYARRNDLVLRALSVARFAGLEAGVRLDPSEPEWPVAVIELPTGQVSWHLPQHAKAWDGHSSDEKYRRIREFADTEGAVELALGKNAGAE